MGLLKILIEGPREARESDNVAIKGKVRFHPSLKYVKWQKLKRGLEIVDINIHSERYTGSSNEIGNPILCINSVDAEDESEYRLEVRRGDKTVYSNTLFLQVIKREGSGKPKMEITCNKKDGKYIFGDDILIMAKITNPLNVLCLTWQKETEEGVEVINTTLPKYDKSSTRIHDSQLHINKATSEDSAYFFLLAAFTYGETESNKVRIHIKGEKPSVSLEQIPRDASIGDTVKCMASIRSTPILTSVVWKKGKEVIDPKDPKYKESTYFTVNPVLKINKINKEDEGVYEIEATNPVGTTCTSVKLTVNGAAPKIKLSLLSPSPQIEYGSSITIKAEIDSFPESSIIKWFKVKENEVEEINTKKPNCRLSKTSTGFLELSINNLDYTDTGKYRIFVENAVGSATEEVNIDVQGIPKLFISGPTVVSPSSTAEYWTLYDAVINKNTVWQKITTTESNDKNCGPKMYSSILKSFCEGPFQKVNLLHKKQSDEEENGNINQDDAATDHVKPDNTITDQLQLSDGSLKSNRINTIVDVFGKFGTEAETNCLRFFHLQSVCAEAMRRAFDTLPPKNFQKKLQK
ncbi:obscurin-like, partial [Saccostrea echinata]|uniref:obscurin-like n=1 Tax=Saccostrea echinata TaxID=191078 RepID=UPI002A81A321